MNNRIGCCLLILICLIVAVLSQGQDPLKDFCRRFGHQTAVIDRRLFIDGGLINYNPISQYPNNITNKLLLYQDLDVTHEGMPQLHANLSKNGSIPDVSGGVLWADTVNKIFYMFGGEFAGQPEGFTLWGYDTILDQWNRSSSSTAQIQRVAYGAGVAVDERGEGYYLGGWLNNKTVPGWAGDPVATSNLVIYNMKDDSWSNNTGPDSVGRAEGVMVFLPASDFGLLIYFGGITTSPWNSTVVGAPMDIIHVYDIASGKWYTQRANGTVPEQRARFCAGATWAQDHSSYNIYIYGGMGMAPNTSGFDDVYILSLPSFIWIKWFPLEPGQGDPHHTLSCNVIDNSQMLIIGGTFPLTDKCDARNVWGTHNLNLGKNNKDKAKWSLFDPNLRTYQVPSEIIAAIGGQASGGATRRAPAQGWDNRDLPVYFNRRASFAPRTATRAIPTATSGSSSTTLPPPKRTSSTGAIAGGATGGAVFLIALVAGIAFWLHKHRKNNLTPSQPAAELFANPIAPPSNKPKDPYHTSTAPAPYSPTTTSPGLSAGSLGHTGTSSPDTGPQPWSPTYFQRPPQPNQPHYQPSTQQLPYQLLDNYHLPQQQQSPGHTTSAHEPSMQSPIEPAEKLYPRPLDLGRRHVGREMPS